MANKLSFFLFLSNMSFHFDHDIVLSAYSEVHESWQMREFEWDDDWKSIEERLKNIRARHQQVPQLHAAQKLPPNNGGDRQGRGNGGGYGSGGGAIPKNNPASSDIKGVPRSYCKLNKLCMKFNGPRGCKKNGVPVVGHHKNESNEAETLLHFCAGCHKKSGAKAPHPVETCDQGPFAPLFRNG